MKFLVVVILVSVMFLEACNSASSQSLPAVTDVFVTNDDLSVIVENDEARPVAVRLVGKSPRRPFRSSASCAAPAGENTCSGTFLLDGVNGTLVTEGILVIEQVGVLSPHSVFPGPAEPFDFWLSVNYNDGLGNLPQRLSVPEQRSRWLMGAQQVRIYHDIASGESVQFVYVRDESQNFGIAKVDMSISGYVVPPGDAGLGP